MPRNGSGVYSLPSATNPVVTATTITSTWANSTLTDVGDALTGSVARDGSGGMTGALRLADGSIAVPGIAFSAETTTGFSRPTTNALVGSVGGIEKFRLNASGASVTGALAVSGALDVGGVAVVTVSGTQTLTNKTLTSPVLTTPNLGTPSAAVLTSATGLPLTTGVTGTLPIANGGTNATTAPDARTALGAAASGAVTASGLTQATARLLGRTTAGTGAPEEISVGSNLTLSAGSLNLATNPAIGAATATTPIAGSNGTGVATTAFVQNRAWVNLNGAGSGDLRRGSWNVSSVTDNATGDYTLNFATGMVDTNYATVVTSTTNSGANAGFYGGLYPGGLYSTSQVQVAVFQSAVGFFDATTVCVAVFR